MTKKLFDNRRKRLSRRRLLFEKVQGSVAGTSDVKKAKDYFAELNFISWLVQYINHALQEQVCHLANLPLTVQLRAVEKSLIMRSNQMGMMKIPSKIKMSATVAIMELPMPILKVFVVLQLQIETKSPFKKRKKWVVKNSNMQRLRWIFSEIRKVMLKTTKKNKMKMMLLSSSLLPN